MEIRKIELLSDSHNPDDVFGFGLKIIQWDDENGKKSRAFFSFFDNGTSWEALRNDMNDELIFDGDEEAWAGSARCTLTGMIEECMRDKGLSDIVIATMLAAMIASDVEVETI